MRLVKSERLTIIVNRPMENSVIVARESHDILLEKALPESSQLSDDVLATTANFNETLNYGLVIIFPLQH